MKPWNEVNFRKILVRVGIAFGIAACFGAVAAYELCWLTSGEHRAAESALVQIDALQSFGSLSDENFDAMANKADDAVEIARQQASTLRDQKVAFALMQYLGSTVTKRSTIQMQGLADQQAPPAHLDLQLNGTMHSTEVAAKRSLSSTLHEALD
jgi:hypothetical protein